MSSSSSAKNSTSLTAAATRGTLLSIVLRLASFFLSQLTFRFVSAAALGKACIPLELLLSTSLFVGREGFRLALTKEIGADDDDDGDDDDDDDQTNGDDGDSDSGDDDNRRNGDDGPKDTGEVNNGKGKQEQRDDDGDGNLGKKRLKEERIIRRRNDEQQQQQKVINVSWLSVPTGAILSLLALLTHLRQCNNNNNNTNNINDDTTSQSRSNNEYYALLDYKLAGILYCLSSFIESLSEPLVIRCLQRMDVTTKAKAEGAALVLKSISCFVCLYCLTSMTDDNNDDNNNDNNNTTNSNNDNNNNNFAVTAFGISQLVYAAVFTSIMYRKGRSSAGGIDWPKKIVNKNESSSSIIHNPYREKKATNGNHTTIKETTTTPPQTSSSHLTQNIHLPTLHLTLLFTLQGLFKHLLTEADKIVLSTLADSYDQGVYALAASYGGLAARLLLQPVEENARLFFSHKEGARLEGRRQRRQRQRCTERGYADDGDEDGINNNSNDNYKDEKNRARKGKEIESKTSTTAHRDDDDDDDDMLKELEDTYFFLLRVVVCIGLLFAAIASNYTSVLLRLLAGRRWGSNAEASAALSAFCVYTAFLALNGTTEAFVYGVARSGNDVGKIGLVHAVVGGVFALIAPGLVRSHGAVGLVSANCIAMALRSSYSLYYARDYFFAARGGGGGGGYCYNYYYLANTKKKVRLANNVVMDTLVRATPHAMVLVSFGASFVMTRSSRNYIYDARIADGRSWMVAGVLHIGVGALCVAFTAALSLWLERDIRSALLQLIKRKRD